jgi:putative glycerol-1-phosphate prenyltransferase
MPKTIYDKLVTAKSNGEKKFVVLIDPDKLRLNNIDHIINISLKSKVDYFFIGGSLVVNNMLDQCLVKIREACDIPMILFPGSSMQISYRADALLFLSLISGRNAELLIGKQVQTAPYIKMSPLEYISTGYMLIDGGIPTTVSYISNTQPIPNNKVDIAMATAMAGEMLGHKLIYMDAGSGAKVPISTDMINGVAGAIDIPLIIGGGIKDPQKAFDNVRAGADVIVVGDAIEKDPSLIVDLSAAVHSFKQDVTKV